jgi:hypothetical protein
MSRGWFFVGSRGRTASPGRRSRRGMIVALVRNKYRSPKKDNP